MIPYQYAWPLLLWALFANIIQSIPTLQFPLKPQGPSQTNHEISADLFTELEELSRIVDIAYCVGLTGAGIQKPFLCASRCQDFEGFELVTVCHYHTSKPEIDIADIIGMEYWPVLF